MRLGQPVSFKTTINITTGVVIGALHNSKPYGIVPEDVTEDGVNVQVDTKGTTIWVPKGEAHKLYRYDGIGKALINLFGVEVGDRLGVEPVPFVAEPAEEGGDEDEDDEDDEVCDDCGESVDDCIC